MMTRRFARRACLAFAASLTLSGCFEQHEVVASWYLVHKTPAEAIEAPDSTPAPTSTPEPPDLYFALQNRGTKIETIRDVSLEVPPKRGENPNSLFELPVNSTKRNTGIRQGGLMILFVKGADWKCDSAVTLPIQLYVRFGEENQAQTIRLKNAMPSTLPEEWLGRC
jgi:hypothetical protein